MTQFTLELLPQSQEILSVSQREILNRGETLAAKIEQEKDYLFVKDEQESGGAPRKYTATGEFVAALRKPTAWRIFEYLDGSVHKNRAAALKVNDRRMDSFTHQEVQEAFTIAVNGALLFEFEGKPGYQHGHSILHESVAGNRISPFYNAITPEFARRLHNGRFWEELPGLIPWLNLGISYRMVEDVLINHEREIEEGFLEEGLRILRRNTEPYKESIFEMTWLSPRAIRTYGRIMQRLEDARASQRIPEADLARAIVPYIRGLDARNEEEELLLPDREELKKAPLVQQYGKYVGESRAA